MREELERQEKQMNAYINLPYLNDPAAEKRAPRTYSLFEKAVKGRPLMMDASKVRIPSYRLLEKSRPLLADNEPILSKREQETAKQSARQSTQKHHLVDSMYQVYKGVRPYENVQSERQSRVFQRESTSPSQTVYLQPLAVSRLQNERAHATT